MEPDFGGYATKAGLRCSDGRVIKADAFQHMDGRTVPLVWQHGHSDAKNVLGHAVLEARPDGVYAYGFFNGTEYGQHAKGMVLHKDIEALSIYANQLKEQNKNVSHGNIREVSLVLSGANPGAKIDYVRIQHGEDPDDVTELDDEAFIHTGLGLDLPEDEAESDAEEETKDVAHAAGADMTVQDVYDSMSEEQQNVCHYMIGAALEQATATHSEDNNDVASDATADGSTAEGTDEGLAHQEGTEMSRNLFENASGASGEEESKTLSHADVKGIMASGIKLGSLKEAVDQYALQHGIENIDILFPDAKNVTGAPEMEKRRTEWVADVLAKVRKTPFSRIKTFAGDLTQDDARAKGYIKGRYKKEEWFGVTKRVTTPATVYKKQKLDRDDILDITDFDVVTWMKAEMRLMTEEEIARAVLIGDGRSVEDEDKVADPMGASSGAGIRSILNDHEVFVTTLNVNVSDANSSYEEVVDAVLDGMEYYKGSGTPTFYTTVRHLNMFKKAKDLNGRRYYENNTQVAEALGVSNIVTVEPMSTQEPDVIGIIVNLDDYNTGTDRGGELTMFDDFDIDYNQYKYLMETRLSGALTKPKSALVVRKVASSAVLVTPQKPAFVPATGIITIPTVTGVTYKNAAGDTISAGAMTALAAGETVVIHTVPTSSSYYFADSVNDSWPFKRPGA